METSNISVGLSCIRLSSDESLTNLRPSKEHKPLDNLRRAYTTNDKGNKLSRGLNVVNTLDVVPVYCVFNASDEPRDAQDDIDVP